MPAFRRPLWSDRDLVHRALFRMRGQPDQRQLVAAGLRLGEGAFIARPTYIDPSRPWLVTIGEHSTLAPFVVVMVHDPSMRVQTGLTRFARVDIGKRVFVGSRAIILPGSVIGDDSVVAATAVVQGDVPAGSLVAGNPAKIISKVQAMTERHLQAVAQAPTWPYEGWSWRAGISAARKSDQRRALAPGTSGYLAVRPRSHRP